MTRTSGGCTDATIVARACERSREATGTYPEKPEVSGTIWTAKTLSMAAVTMGMLVVWRNERHGLRLETSRNEDGSS